ncbi:MAG: hypothetical protein ACHQTF_11080 [Gemmatimonadales bacterium]
MSEESTNPDLAEIVRRASDAFNRRDDAWVSFFSPDVVYRPVPARCGRITEPGAKKLD